MGKLQERRDFWRAPFHSLAQLTCPAGIMREGRLHDISLKGALLEMVDDWHGAPGDHCSLKLDLSPDVSIRMQTTVKHVEGRRMGLRCDEIDIDSITNLRRLVELNSDDPELLERELSALVHYP